MKVNGATGEVDDTEEDGLEEAERLFLEAVEGRGEEAAPAGENIDDDAGKSPSEKEELSSRSEKAAKARRIAKYIAYEFGRRESNFLPRAGIYLDEDIRNRALWAAFNEVCRIGRVASRDAEAYVRCYLFGEPSAEVARKSGIKANHLYQIKFRIEKKLGLLGRDSFERYQEEFFRAA